MEFEMTPQRLAYLEARGKVILNACPGSGKTTCIIKKLPLLEAECLEKHSAHAGIVCLSFTNVAKNEILHKYKHAYGTDFKFPHLVSTIDSFINQYITLPFFNVLRADLKRPQIIDNAYILDKLTSIKYLSNGKWVEGIQKPLNTFKNQAGRPLYISYPPSAIWVNAAGTFTFNGKMPDARTVDPDVFQAYGKALMNWKVNKGYITSLDSAYLALLILHKAPRIGKWLVDRFPYMIIDEAQDNSEVQHKIFDKLISLGLTNIEMIGDPYQSLYEWRDAKPQLFVQKMTDANWTGLPLSQNRRSVQRIIDCFSIIRHGDDEPIVTANAEDLNIPVLVYRYNATNPKAIVGDFEQRCIDKKFTKNHIVVRGTTLRDRMLGNTTVVNPWKTSFPSRLLRIKHHFECNEVKDAVDELRDLVLPLKYPSSDYHDSKKIEKEKARDFELNGKLYRCLFDIPETDLSIQDWTDHCIGILDQHFQVDAQDAFIFKQKIDGFKMVELKKQSVNLYFNKPASTTHNIPVTTIHKVKGSTLDAILYFFDERSTGESVSFNDFTRSTGFPSEKQRMIYVACSRPQQLLALAFPERITEAQLKGKFGEHVEIKLL